MLARWSLYLVACSLVGLSACSAGPSYPREERARATENPPFEGRRPTVRATPVEWQDHELVSRRELVVSYRGGDTTCYGLSHVKVRYQKMRILATVYAGKEYPGNQDCFSAGVFKEVSIQLSEDASGRYIRNAAQGIDRG